MKADHVFSAACAFVLAISVAGAVLHGFQASAPRDPRAQLSRFLEQTGLVPSARQDLIQGEELITLRVPGCLDPVEVLYLPVISRISAPARALVRARPEALFVHDGRAVASLGAADLIPRWLWRRALVNLQVADEDPWISIALAVFPPKGCAMPRIDWTTLSGT